MGPVRTPYMGTFEALLEALVSERSTFAASSVMDKARITLVQQKTEIDEARVIIREAETSIKRLLEDGLRMAKELGRLRTELNMREELKQ